MMTRSRVFAGPVAGAFTGLALGIAMPAGAAMLLATDERLLGAAGLLTGLGLAALAVAIWAGAPGGGDADDGRAAAAAGRRWVFAVIVYLIAGLFGQLWIGQGGAVRALGPVRALAALLLIAAPAYATGAVLAVLIARARPVGAGVFPAAALIGAALGVTLTGLVLIPRFDPGTVFFVAAVAIGIAAAVETRSV